MPKIEVSVFDKIEESSKIEEEQVAVETAAQNVLRQQMMEKAGSLQRVHFIGPNGYIPGFYSPAERAFLPEFINNES